MTIHQPIPVRTPDPFVEIERQLDAPAFAHASPCDWGVLLYGGLNPKGFLNPPLEFAFFGKHYTRERIEQKAADLASWHKRAFWQVQEPSDKRFIKESCNG